MTETDKIYLAFRETIKKYGPEHVVKGLREYITKYNDAYITRENNARKIINEVHPYYVMADVLRTTLKYEIIENEKGYAKVVGNEQRILHAINSHQNGNKIRVVLSSHELDELMRRMIKNNVDDTLDMLAANPEIFDSYLVLYLNLISRNLRDLNEISNEQFTSINEYFEGMFAKEKQK